MKNKNIKGKFTPYKNHFCFGGGHFLLNENGNSIVEPSFQFDFK